MADSQRSILTLSRSSVVVAITLLLVCLSVPELPAQTLDLSGYEVVDLSYSFDAGTIFWPTAKSGFDWKLDFAGKTDGGYYYSAASFATPEHIGTHVDAPVHFAEGQVGVEGISLDRLIAPAVVIDVSGLAAADADYRATAQDVKAFEAEHGKIAEGTIVLLHTGFGKRWPDRKTYLGDDTLGDASKLHFPSYSEEAARLLVEERKVAAIGVDTASIDYGQSTDFIVHQVAAAHGVPGLENVAHLERVPATGAIVIALPIKITGGTGAPARFVALVPRQEP